MYMGPCIPDTIRCFLLGQGLEADFPRESRDPEKSAFAQLRRACRTRKLNGAKSEHPQAQLPFA